MDGRSQRELYRMLDEQRCLRSKIRRLAVATEVLTFVTMLLLGCCQMNRRNEDGKEDYNESCDLEVPRSGVPNEHVQVCQPSLYYVGYGILVMLPAIKFVRRGKDLPGG
jgi:hypothetical protein